MSYILTAQSHEPYFTVTEKRLTQPFNIYAHFGRVVTAAVSELPLGR